MVAGLFAVGCVLLIAGSTPRRVGDGVEYWAMAEQLAALSRPSASRGDLSRLERDTQRIGGGFDQSPLRFPELVAADGRQDFPHFWLYSLVNVPALWVVKAIDVHPAWAFTITNVALLAIAFVVVAQHASIVWSLLLLGGPLIWWVDKAHGDVFTLSLVAMACACWRRAPAWTLWLLAIAAAQNPVMMPVWALVAVLAVSRAATYQGRRTTAGLVGGGVMLAVPLAYYQMRLQVWSPLVGYTHPAMPSVRTVVSLLIDPNIGLVPNAPFVVIAVVAAMIVALFEGVSLRGSWREWLMTIGAWTILLAGYAQSVNMNHGATPSVNRWTLWLTPWPMLIALAIRRSANTNAANTNAADSSTADSNTADSNTADSHAAAASHRRSRSHIDVLLVGLAVANTIWAVWFFRPSQPEVYRYPTPLAAWMWTHAPEWYAPAPEIFAERVSHREPAVVPVAWEGCTMMLLIDGEWPAPCVPTTPTPAACAGPDRLCYAIPPSSSMPSSSPISSSPIPSGTSTGAGGDARTTFIPLGDAGFGITRALHRWPGNRPFVVALRTRLARDPALRPDEGNDTAVRAADHIAWTSVWRSPSSFVIYVEDASADALIRMRLDADQRGVLIDLDTNTELAALAVARSAGQPASLELPAPVHHGLIWLEASSLTAPPGR